MLRPILSSAIRVGVIAIAFIPGWNAVEAQGYPARYPSAGRYYERPGASAAERTIGDLRQISRRETFSHGEHERYEHAVEHLSQFTGKLYRGKFDRGKLERGIEDLQSVLQRNRLDPRARDTLSFDLNQLYRLRSNYGGMGYRY